MSMLYWRCGTRVGDATEWNVREELRRYWIQPTIIAATVLIADQLSKAWVLDALGTAAGTSRPVIEPWLSLTLVHNTGVAFGMFQGIPHFFTVTSVIISIAAIYFYRRHLPSRSWFVQLCVGLIVGGAIGNIIDRLRFGYVIDFVHVSWFPGIFNVADSGITVGVIALTLFLLIRGDGERDAPAGDQALLGTLLGGGSSRKRE